MKNLLRSYKTELRPTKEQMVKIHQTIGTCRYVYNFYLSHNLEIYENEKRFVSGNAFAKWLNHEFLPANEDKKWIKEVSSKAVKKSIMNAETAFQRFFKGVSDFPRYKKKGVSDPKMYFVKTDAKTVIACEKRRIKIPTLGWVRLKEKGYLPTCSETHVIKSGTVSLKAGRYYVSVLVEEPDVCVNVPKQEEPQKEGIGIDLGLKEFAVMSNGAVKKNINKTARVKKIEKQLRREQRKLSRKQESFKRRTKASNEKEKGKKGEATRQNIQKQKQKVQKLYHRLECIRTDYVNKCVHEVVKAKPGYVSMEDLNVSGMMKNRHLSKAVAGQKFYEFRVKLQKKCKDAGIEVRVVDRFYPSSRRCHCCGKVKKDLKLSDRIYRCECGYQEDRDYNASLNLRDAETYRIASVA